MSGAYSEGYNRAKERREFTRGYTRALDEIDEVDEGDSPGSGIRSKIAPEQSVSIFDNRAKGRLNQVGADGRISLDSAAPAAAPKGGAAALPGNTNRWQNIADAKISGTFEGIRADHNAKNPGRTMDELGNIAPATAPAAAPAPAGGATPAGKGAWELTYKKNNGKFYGETRDGRGQEFDTDAEARAFSSGSVTLPEAPTVLRTDAAPDATSQAWAAEASGRGGNILGPSPVPAPASLDALDGQPTAGAFTGGKHGLPPQYRRTAATPAPAAVQAPQTFDQTVDAHVKSLKPGAATVVPTQQTIAAPVAGGMSAVTGAPLPVNNARPPTTMDAIETANAVASRAIYAPGQPGYVPPVLDAGPQPGLSPVQSDRPNLDFPTLTRNAGAGDRPSAKMRAPKTYKTPSGPITF